MDADAIAVPAAEQPTDEAPATDEAVPGTADEAAETLQAAKARQKGEAAAAKAAAKAEAAAKKAAAKEEAAAKKAKAKATKDEVKSAKADAAAKTKADAAAAVEPAAAAVEPAASAAEKEPQAAGVAAAEAAPHRNGAAEPAQEGVAEPAPDAAIDDEEAVVATAEAPADEVTPAEGVPPADANDGAALEAEATDVDAEAAPEKGPEVELSWFARKKREFIIKQARKEDARKLFEEEAVAKEATILDDYVPSYDGAIPMSKGASVKVMNQDSSDWWRVLFVADDGTRSIGFIPSSFCWIQEPVVGDPAAAAAAAAADLQEDAAKPAAAVVADAEDIGTI